MYNIGIYIYTCICIYIYIFVYNRLEGQGLASACCALFPELVRDWVVAAQLLHSSSHRSAFSARSAGLCLAVRIAIFMAPCSKGLKFISKAEHMLGCCNPDKSLLFFIAFE